MAGLALKDKHEIWSQLYYNCREAQMFLLFLPSHILLNLPSLLPSLAVPSIRRAAARKPGSIHRSSSKHQLIIFPAITHLPLHLPLISSTGNISFVRQKLRRLRLQRAAGHAEQSHPCSIYLLDWNCVFDQGDDDAGVLVQLHVSAMPHPIVF